jgi:hypothetical protein
MKRRFFLCALSLASMLWATGCVSTVDGRHRAGWPIGQDTIEGRYARPVLECWAAAKDVLSHQGQLTSEDSQRSTLQGTVNERDVWVKIEPLDQKVTRVIVQARTKGGGADVAVASEIDKQIAVRLATGNLTPSNPPR